MRINNAKVRLQERARKNQEGGADDSAKRRKLADIEDKVMTEEDPDKLTQLFEQYKEEYLKDRGNEDERENKRKKQENTSGMREAAKGSQDPIEYEEMSIDAVEGMDLWEHLGKIPMKDSTPETWDHNDDEYLKTSVDRDDEYAWDDVNDIASLLDRVKKARKEEMEYM